IEGAELVGTVAVYYYLRSAANSWPPGDMPLPSLLIPTIGTLLLLISVIPSYLDDVAIKKGDVRGMVINMIWQIVLETAFTALLVYHLKTLNFMWDENAYASVYWVAIVLSLIFTVAMIFESLYMLVLAFRGVYNAERRW